MKLNILFFANLREAFGMANEQVETPESVTNVGELQQWLADRGPVWAEKLAQGNAVRTAVDQTLVPADAALHEGAEVAFFPPVTGG